IAKVAKLKRTLKMEKANTSEAKQAIRKILLGKGGSAQVRIGNTTRLLCHDSVINRPLRHLPWPFSLLQAHIIDYSVYEEKAQVEEQTFERRQVDDAIRLFLRDLN